MQSLQDLCLLELEKQLHLAYSWEENKWSIYFCNPKKQIIPLVFKEYIRKRIRCVNCHNFDKKQIHLFTLNILFGETQYQIPNVIYCDKCIVANTTLIYQNYENYIDIRRLFTRVAHSIPGTESITLRYVINLESDEEFEDSDDVYRVGIYVEEMYMKPDVLLSKEFDVRYIQEKLLKFIDIERKTNFYASLQAPFYFTTENNYKMFGSRIKNDRYTGLRWFHGAKIICPDVKNIKKFADDVWETTTIMIYNPLISI